MQKRLNGWKHEKDFACVADAMAHYVKQGYSEAEGCIDYARIMTNGNNGAVAIVPAGFLLADSYRIK